MANPSSFNALLRFPENAYFDFNSSMNGIAVVDSISREAENYHANISFPLKNLSDCIKAIDSCSGVIVEIVPDKETMPAVVRKYATKRKGQQKTKVAFPKTRGKNTRISKLREMLADKYMSVKQVQKATGWPPSTIHSRFTGLRKHKMLLSKNGPGGRMVYKIAAAAA
jgi:hypothetical protein